MKKIEDLLEYNTAAPTGWRCPEHLYPGASARRALRHGGGAVGHELSVVLINDLRTKEVRLLYQHTSEHNASENASFLLQRKAARVLSD